METKLTVALVFVWAVCHVTSADLPNPTTLETNITAAGCRSSKLCAGVSNCDPSVNSSCFFSSIQVNNQSVSFELSGPSSGYIALGLAASNQSQGSAIVFVCSNNNNSFSFSTATQNGTVLTSANVSTVFTVQGVLKQNQSLIQCTFNTTNNLTINLASNIVISNSTINYITILRGDSNGTMLGNASTAFSSITPSNQTGSTVNVPTLINITRSGCGVTKLCMSNPNACDPAGSSCYFASSKVNEQKLIFELSGRTSGYVALGLTKQTATYVFVCGSNNSSFFFATATQNGTMLTPASVSTIYNYLGNVTGTGNNSLIQCIFNTITSFSTKADDTSYTVTILTGPTNGTQLGNATTRYTSKVPLDLSNSSALQTTQSTSTASPGSSGNSITSFWTHVLAVLLSAMTLILSQSS